MFIVNLIGVIVSALMFALWILITVWIVSLGLPIGTQDGLVFASGMCMFMLCAALWCDFDNS